MKSGDIQLIEGLFGQSEALRKRIFDGGLHAGAIVCRSRDGGVNGSLVVRRFCRRRRDARVAGLADYTQRANDHYATSN